MGAGVCTGQAAAVLCTSGTAATHFHAAVVEADLSGVPMVVITADRPPELQGIGAPQTIDQTELYGNAVRWYHDPGVAAADSAHRWRTIAHEAIATAVAVDNPGPVHLNLPFREPLLGVAGDLPSADVPLADLVAQSASVDDLDVAAAAALVNVARVVVVAGRGAGVDAVRALAAQRGWPVLADPRSGCRSLPQAIAAFDALLRVRSFADAQRPEAVLLLGEPPASKVLAQWLASLDVPQVQVHHQPRVIDPDAMVSLRLVAPVGAVCELLVAHGGPTDAGWCREWTQAEAAAQLAIEAVLGEAVLGEAVLSEPAVARALTGPELAPGTQLVVSSSMPIRDVEWFGNPSQHATVHANRGANGIDGVIATAIGVALATDVPTVALVGDVAFCHDASSLTGLSRRHVNLAIVVVDNDGGGIFSFLPQATALDTPRFEQLFGTPHGTDVLALAAAHGLATTTATTPRELLDAVRRPGVSVVRVASTRAGNVATHDRLNAAVADAL